MVAMKAMKAYNGPMRYMFLFAYPDKTPMKAMKAMKAMSRRRQHT